jgi:prephenate dehydrogenase
MNWAAKYNKKDSNTLRLAAGGFRDMTRIASSVYGMWKDIITTNQDEIESRLDEFLEELRLLKADLRAGKLEDHFDSARSARHTIPRDVKGFMHPLHEILVVVDDRPGVIASISKILAEADINISDIEVMKVREGEGGTLRFGFESAEAAAEAVKRIGRLNYQARIRE